MQFQMAGVGRDILSRKSLYKILLESHIPAHLPASESNHLYYKQTFLHCKQMVKSHYCHDASTLAEKAAKNDGMKPSNMRLDRSDDFGQPSVQCSMTLQHAKRQRPSPHNLRVWSLITMKMLQREDL